MTLIAYGIGVVGSLRQVGAGIKEGWVAAAVNGAVVGMNRPDTGFSIREGVFDRTVMLEVLEALDRAELTRTRAGARHVLKVPTVRAQRWCRSPDKSVVSSWLVAWHQDTALPIQREALSFRARPSETDNLPDCY